MIAGSMGGGGVSAGSVSAACRPVQTIEKRKACLTVRFKTIQVSRGVWARHICTKSYTVALARRDPILPKVDIPFCQYRLAIRRIRHVILGVQFESAFSTAFSLHSPPI